MNTTDKIQYRISTGLKILLGVIATLNFLAGDYFFFGASLLVLLLAFLPAIITRRWCFHLPPEIDLFITILLFLHYVLGEYGGFYEKFYWWDIFLHGLNSIIFGIIGVIFLYALLMTSKIKAKPFVVSLLSVFFAVFIGVLWEIFEFLVDQALGFNMQKSGLMDTMTDLITDVIGAVIAGGFGFVYLKQPNPVILNNIISRFLEFAGKRKLKRMEN